MSKLLLISVRFTLSKRNNIFSSIILLFNIELKGIAEAFILSSLVKSLSFCMACS